MVSHAVATHFLFVYGTLMKGLQEDWQTKVGARLVGRGRINGKLYALGEYPGAISTAADSGEYVKGELYEVKDAELATRILDQFEEYFPRQPQKSLFVRIIAPVTLEDGRRQNAWVYVYNQPVDETTLIPSGDYRDSFARRER
jgi:gamma-glutamylcyclotransferase (GGCT)/AIG2-like uncharacterized protein YtfP